MPHGETVGQDQGDSGTRTSLLCLNPASCFKITETTTIGKPAYGIGCKFQARRAYGMAS